MRNTSSAAVNPLAPMENIAIIELDAWTIGAVTAATMRNAVVHSNRMTGIRNVRERAAVSNSVSTATVAKTPPRIEKTTEFVCVQADPRSASAGDERRGVAAREREQRPDEKSEAADDHEGEECDHDAKDSRRPERVKNAVRGCVALERRPRADDQVDRDRSPVATVKAVGAVAEQEDFAGPKRPDNRSTSRKGIT